MADRFVFDNEFVAVHLAVDRSGDAASLAEAASHRMFGTEAYTYESNESISVST
jgi:hypothetical protein